MSSKKELSGCRFERLLVLRIDEEKMKERKLKNKRNRTYWLCKCDCGNYTSVVTDGLTGGKTKSCGCYGKEMALKYHKEMAITGNSFAKYLIDLYGEDAIDKYWSEKNSVSPWEISEKSNKPIWIKCAKKEYHDDYYIKPRDFTRTKGCPYCSPMSKKCNIRDSFGQWCLDNIDVEFFTTHWSDKNVINPFAVKNSSTENIYIKCQETDYHEDYKLNIKSYVDGKRCPFCSHNNGKCHPRDSFAQWGINKYGSDFLKKYWNDKNTLDPWSIPTKSLKRILINYQYDCVEEFLEIRTSHFVNGRDYKIKGLRSEFHKYNVGEIINNKEITSLSYKTRKNGYNEKSYVCKCNDCKKQQEIVEGVIKYKKCVFCGDSVSFGEKFIFKLLSDLDIEFEKEKHFEWRMYEDSLKFYDFYIPRLKTIIEVHGIQHYEQTRRRGGRTLEEEQENDKYKKGLALANGIEHYIVIDARKSELEWIKNSILNSELANMFDLSELNWDECLTYCFSSLVKEVCDLWNKGLKSTTLIIDKTKLGRSSIIKYLKIGNKLGMCVYNKDIIFEERNKLFEENKYCYKKVICLNDKKIYKSMAEAQRVNKIRDLSSVCKGERLSCGVDERSNMPFKWMYYEDYLYIIENCIELFNDEDELRGYIFEKYHGKKFKDKRFGNKKRNIQVYCINNSMVYNSLEEARLFCNLKDSSSITRNCKGIIKTAGKHPVTREPLKWIYYDEYRMLNNKDLVD